MRNKKKSYLCVGGPLGGKRYAILYGTGFTVPVYEEMPDPESLDYQPNKPVKVENIRYREETFRTQEGDVSFFVPEGQTPFETMTLLLETYERQK